MTLFSLRGVPVWYVSSCDIMQLLLVQVYLRPFHLIQMCSVPVQCPDINIKLSLLSVLNSRRLSNYRPCFANGFIFFNVMKLQNVRLFQGAQNALYKRGLICIFLLHLKDSRAILYTIFRHFFILFFIKFLDQLVNCQVLKKDSTRNYT